MNTNQENWEKIICTQEKSGKSAPQFCHDGNYKIHTFRYWRSKLRSKNSPETMPGSFQPVEVSQSACPLLKVKYPNGIHLEIFSPIASDFLKCIDSIYSRGM